MRLFVATLCALGLALTGPALAQLTPPSTVTTVTVTKLALDSVPELKDSRTKLEGVFPTLAKAAKGKTEWREGVVLLRAADRARKAGDTTSAKKLSTEANARFDLAQKLATGGAGTNPGLAALKADLLLGKYVTPADTDVSAPLDTLTSVQNHWTTQGFEPVTM